MLLNTAKFYFELWITILLQGELRCSVIRVFQKEPTTLARTFLLFILLTVYLQHLLTWLTRLSQIASDKVKLRLGRSAWATDKTVDGLSLWGAVGTVLCGNLNCGLIQ